MKKYHVGEYVGGKHFKTFRIESIIDGVMPIYALRNPYVNNNSTSGHPYWWLTEYCLEAFKFTLVVPDFEKWESVETGDMLAHSHEHEKGVHTEFVKVLARAGNLLLLSMAPIQDKEDPSDQLLKQLDELSNEIGVPTETTEKVKEMITNVLPDSEVHVGIQEIDDEINKTMKQLTLSHKMADMANGWRSIEELVLNGHWEIMKE